MRGEERGLWEEVTGRLVSRGQVAMKKSRARRWLSRVIAEELIVKEKEKDNQANKQTTYV